MFVKLNFKLKNSDLEKVLQVINKQKGLVKKKRITILECSNLNNNIFCVFPKTQFSHISEQLSPNPLNIYKHHIFWQSFSLLDIVMSVFIFRSTFLIAGKNNVSALEILTFSDFYKNNN